MINEAEKYERISKAFARVRRSSEKRTRKLRDDLYTLAGKSHDDDITPEVEIYEYLPSEVHDSVSLLVPHEMSESDINKNTVEVCEFDVGLNAGCDINDFLKRFLSGLASSVANSDRGLINLRTDNYGREILLLEDGGFRYKVCLAYGYDHVRARLGYEGNYVELSDESEPESEPCQEPMIKIFLKDGTVVYLPAFSTPIDVGFRIHRDIGYAVCGAQINGKEKPITTRLREGDHVVIKTTDKAKDGSRPTTAKIAWLYYVRTNEARKCLIKFFSLRYEGLHSDNVTATNEEADRVFDAAMRALNSI